MMINSTESQELAQSRAMKDRIAKIFGSTPESVAKLRKQLDGPPEDLSYVQIQEATYDLPIDPETGMPIFSTPHTRSLGTDAPILVAAPEQGASAGT